MRLDSVSIKNFRCYGVETNIELDDLTVIIGKNDIGKSTVLEALEIFFNNNNPCIDQADANINSESKKVEITCTFSELPTKITLDAGAETSLSEEYLLDKNGKLKIRKTYDCNLKKPSPEIFIIANHPSAHGVNNLLEFKESDLQKKIRELSLSVSLKGNPGMRKAIWASAQDLALTESAIPIMKAKEDTKKIWDQLAAYLPIFALFQSDRSSRDSDDEVQNPLKAAISSALAELREEIGSIQRSISEKVQEIVQDTYEALKNIEPRLASELKAEFSNPTNAKWQNLFAVGLNTDSGIPLNKRGSGIRRLILVSFFKAEAERLLKQSNRKNIIYAIEEPETAQHPNNQKLLIESFMTLAAEKGCQVLLTTHSPGLVSDLPKESIRFIDKCSELLIPVVRAGADVFEDVAKALGVVPDSRVKVLVCVEGPTDITALKYLSNALHLHDQTLPNLLSDHRFAFIVLGGSTLVHWANQNYLRALKKPEFHIYDSDVTKYQQYTSLINARMDGSWAGITKKYEIENYLHTEAIRRGHGVSMHVNDHPETIGGKLQTVGNVFSAAHFDMKKTGAPMNEDTAKKKLSKAFQYMTADFVRQRDPEGEVIGWMIKLGELARLE